MTFDSVLPLPGRFMSSRMWKISIISALLSTTSAKGMDVPRCDSSRIQKIAGAIYVKGLRDHDPQNLLELADLQAVLTDVKLLSLDDLMSFCSATISFSMNANKLSDHVGNYRRQGDSRALNKMMIDSGRYALILVQIFDFIHKRSAFTYQARHSDQEGKIDVTDDLFVSSLK